MKKIDFLLINPPIYDFAAYDLWIKPLGLYNILNILNSAGFTTQLLDCLDRNTFSNLNEEKYNFPTKKITGEGKFIKKEIEKPSILKNIKRKYSRYGLPINALKEELNNRIKPKAVLITSMMTYWYPALFDTIKMIKEIYPQIPIITGGVYTTLCYDHAAANSNADIIFKGPFSAKVLLEILSKTGITKNNNAPVFDDFTTVTSSKNKGIAAILTSRGCPYNCSYCASKLLYKTFTRRSIISVIEEIEILINNYQIKDIIFYEDALLVDSENHIIPILDEIINKNYKARFHVPNGLHLRNITDKLAELMIRAGFKELRFGYEYSDQKLQKNDGKITNREFKDRINILRKSGFKNNDIGINIMAGTPGQTFESAFETVKFIQNTGLKMHVSEYSPIPGTMLWDKAIEFSGYDIINEPLFHNNTLFPCEWDKFTMKQLNFLKTEAKRPAL